MPRSSNRWGEKTEYLSGGSARASTGMDGTLDMGGEEGVPCSFWQGNQKPG